MIDPIVSAAQLASQRGVILFDVRTGATARADHARAHLPGAIFVDLETDLAAKGADAVRGGRHPLPAIEDFARQLGAWGVTPASHVVVYDTSAGANAAARLWWMLRAVGHERVQVLDGGLAAAEAAGLALTDVPATPDPTAAYPLDGRAWPTVTIDEVDARRQQAGEVVLDVRSAERFDGIKETIDPIAGHIPGARNLPFTDNLTGGVFKPAAELRAMYERFLGDVDPAHLVVHCGSGVTACHTLLALERAGLPGARLFVGSWSEWCRDPERPRAP